MFKIKKSKELTTLDTYKIFNLKREFFVIEEDSIHIWYENNMKFSMYLQVIKEGNNYCIRDLKIKKEAVTKEMEEAFLFEAKKYIKEELEKKHEELKKDLEPQERNYDFA